MSSGRPTPRQSTSKDAKDASKDTSREAAEVSKPEYPELDVSKLHSLPSEQQDLYLLTFASDLARHVANLDSDGASAHQMYVKKELLQIIGLSAPAPTRVIRRNLGLAFAGIFGKGDRKLLFESVNDLVAILNAGKAEKDHKAKHAAVHCLGTLFEAAGDSAIGLSSLAYTTTMKMLKVAANHAGFRASIFESVARTVRMIGGSTDEAVARDIWKQCRNAVAGEKSQLVQIKACLALESFAKHTSYFDNSNDFEKLCSAIWKVIDSPSPKVRHAAANALATVLVKSYTDTPDKTAVPLMKKPTKKKKKKGADDEDEEHERAESPAPRKPVTRLSFDLGEILKQLSSHYTRASTNARGRAGLAVCYIKVIKGLQEGTIQSKYGEIAQHLFNDLMSSSTISGNRYRALSTRKFVRIILEDVIGKEILGEAGQLGAVRFLVNDIIKDYPQSLKERPEPTKQVLTGSLSALASLMKSLGSAISSISDSIREGLLQNLQHPNYTVQVHTSAALRAFVLACPQQLLPTVTICMNTVNRELGQLGGPRQSPKRCVGFANGLSAVLSTATVQPLYGSLEVNSRVLSQATTLLKSSSSSDLRVSSIQIQVAWILIGGLMSLGPNFTKIHLSQLLLLWKNALPRPLGKENMAQRNILELSFLAHVRECALGSMLAFLDSNSRLLTLDVTKRLAAMLQNTSVFLTTLPAKKGSDEMSNRLSPSLQLQDYDMMVRRRVLQCYTKLINAAPAGSVETLLQSNLLPLAISSFADPNNYSPSSMNTSIQTSAGAFESVWDVTDNLGFGINGLVRGFEVKAIPGEQNPNGQHHWATEKGAVAYIDQTLQSPVCNGREHDSILLYLQDYDESQGLPNPPSTQVVNAAVNLFAIFLPLQTARVQESMLEQVSTYLMSRNLERDPLRKQAMMVNVATALLSALKVANKETTSSPGDLRSPGVEKSIQEILHTILLDQDQYVRSLAAEAIGRLCSSSGNSFTTSEINILVEQIVANREPTARAGCAVALGCIHSQLGGMAAGYHLKNILGILMSLANDPHPSVHFWALDSLSKVADSAGLTFSGYVSSTLGMLAQLYASDSHNEETGSMALSNFEVDNNTVAVIARCVDSIINVLGPDLQDMTKPRDLILSLITQFQNEGRSLVLIEALHCLEHLSLYAAGHMHYAEYVQRLQADLESPDGSIRDVAIDGLHNLMRRDAEDVIKTAKPGLEDRIWLIMNTRPEHETAQNIIRNWLTQTALQDTTTWVARCNYALTRTIQKAEAIPQTAVNKPTAIDLADEDVAGFVQSGGGKDEPPRGLTSQELLRWQVRTFAMERLSEIVSMVARDAAAKEESAAEAALQAKVSEVVRIAFSASTAGVVELRVKGLRIIDQMLKLFGKTPDPDFPEASLLEQYQAQIGSALTPAFAADSSPELAAEAVNVCATFTATGIVTDAERMGRILRLLVSALENFSSESEAAAIGDLKGLSSNAQIMVKMAIFSAWAELQIASHEQKYLKEVLAPHIAKLTPLWLASLREFARLRFEPDISSSGPGPLSGDLDTVYAALNRETLLKFYQDAWLNLVDAIASLIDEDSELVFDALDGKETGENADDENGSKKPVAKASDINYRDEPVAFFFVLFGLAFEALASRPGDSQKSQEHTLEILQALKKILRPSVAGYAIYQEVVFNETMELLDRLTLTESLNVQAVIVEIARNLCVNHPSARKGSEAGDENLSDDIEQLFELTRIIVLVLAGLVPNLADRKNQPHHQLTEEAVNLLTLSLSSMVTAADVFPSIIKTDLHACILHIFSTIIGTPSCQIAVVPQSLPILRQFLTRLVASPQADTQAQLRGTLTRILATLRHAQRREHEASLACEKNSIMAATLLVSTAGAAFDSTDPLLPTFATILLDMLENSHTVKVAAGCARSLLALPKGPRSPPANGRLASLLVPPLASQLATDPRAENGDPDREILDARPTLSAALTSLVPSFGADEKRAAQTMGIVLPTLLTRASIEGPSTWHETAGRLVEMAGASQMGFRAIVAGLEPKRQELLQRVVREGGGGGAKKEEKKEEAPTIALRMDFGAAGKS